MAHMGLQDGDLRRLGRIPGPKEEDNARVYPTIPGWGWGTPLIPRMTLTSQC